MKIWEPKPPGTLWACTGTALPVPCHHKEVILLLIRNNNNNNNLISTRVVRGAVRSLKVPRYHLHHHHHHIKTRVCGTYCTKPNDSLQSEGRGVLKSVE